jgi:hypothetical protein
VDIGHITDKSIFLEGKEGIPYPSLIIYRATEDEFSFMD